MIGRILGHYKILEKIGAGGMGVVYRAHDERLDRDVALKVLLAGTLADESACKRFRKEALALAKLNHANIAAVYDFDSQDGPDFLAMEFIPGTTLDEKLAAGALPEKEVAALGVQIAAALDEAHQQGVVHCDLKPGHIKVTPNGQVKVLDFGLTNLVRTLADVETTVNMTALPYMAPEQLRGEPDARADLYAAGAVLYEMATGRRPFPETHGLIDSILHHVPEPPRKFNRTISSRLEELILKCLEKDPEKRYQSAMELLVAVQDLAAPARISPSRVPRVSIPRRKP